jgi:Domain of unknown function (DUF4375)
VTSKDWFPGWSSETTEELLALAGRYRTDSIVLAFEEALGKKSFSGEPLSLEERYVCAIEALEREVNNGGYDQFFLNSSNEYVGIIVAALESIGCPHTARVTRDAIEHLGSQGDLTPENASGAAKACEDEEGRASRLSGCDQRYFEGIEEPISDRLFSWIERNRQRIRVGKSPG